MVSKYISRIGIAGVCLFYNTCLFAQRTDSITIYFNPDEYTINSTSISALQLFVRDKICVYEIVGYTDTTNTMHYNKALAKKRADAVKNLLATWNVPACEDFIVEYYGETNQFGNQLADNRVVIVKAKVTTTEPVQLSSSPSPDTVATTDSLLLSTDKILFYPDSYRIRPESLDYLDDLFKQLRSYHIETFEIIGHVNYQSNRQANQLKDIYKLSEDRAKAVATILIQKGLPSDRITYKGVGNSQPVYTNPQNLEQRMQNMRVEIYIHR